MCFKIVVLISLTLNCFFILDIFINVLQLENEKEVENENNLSISPLCNKFDQFDRLKINDLSIDSSHIDIATNEVELWDLCASIRQQNDTTLKQTLTINDPIYKPIKYCAFTALIEQQFQFRFFREKHEPSIAQSFPCVLLPPQDYRWPSKHVKFPAISNRSVINWSNLGVNSYRDLVAFYPKYPKNVHHFDTPDYDIQQEKLVDIAAKYIPFGKKIRTMLDIGAGAGSMTFILNKRYDVTVLGTAFSDFPYCEFVSERGGLCILLDSRYVLPFAKFSFDVIHHNWVFHSLTPNDWRDVIIEQNRILRPGGYLWIADGLSFAQLKTIKYLLLEQLGYEILFENEIHRRKVKVYFALNPYEVDWHAIFVKPHRLKKELHQCT